MKCRTCKNEFGIEMMKKGDLGTCKACHNEANKVRAQLKKANNFPAYYLSCDDCDAIFHKHPSGRSLKDQKKPERTCCPKCFSDNINNF